MSSRDGVQPVPRLRPSPQNRSGERHATNRLRRLASTYPGSARSFVAKEDCYDRRIFDGKALKEKLDTCTLHPSVHCALLYYGYGKSKEVRCHAVQVCASLQAIVIIRCNRLRGCLV